MEISHCGQSESLASDGLAEASRDVSSLFRRLRQLEVRVVEITRNRDAKSAVRFEDHQARLDNIDTRLDALLLEASQILREGQASIGRTVGSLDQKLAASDGAHQQRWREMCAAAEAQHSSVKKAMDVLRHSITERKNAEEELAANMKDLADTVSNKMREQKEMLLLRDQLSDDLERQASFMNKAEGSFEKLTRALDERAGKFDLDLVSQRIEGVRELANRTLQRCKELSECHSQDVVRLDALEARLEAACERNLENSESTDAAAASAALAMTTASRICEQIETISGQIESASSTAAAAAAKAEAATAAAEAAAAEAVAAFAAATMPKPSPREPSFDDSVDMSTHCACSADSDSVQLEGHSHMLLESHFKHSDESRAPAVPTRPFEEHIPPSWSRPQAPTSIQSMPVPAKKHLTEDHLVCQGNSVLDGPRISSTQGRPRTPRRAMDTWLEVGWPSLAKKSSSSTAARRPASARARIGCLDGIAEDLSSCIAPSASSLACPGPGKPADLSSCNPHFSETNKKFAISNNSVPPLRARKTSF